MAFVLRQKAELLFCNQLSVLNPEHIDQPDGLKFI
jgi:hypothetical protein